MSVRRIVLVPGRDGPVRRGHPWIFSRAIAEGLPDAEPGEPVRVVAADALVFLQGAAPVRFDLVFLDPPYAAGLLLPAWQALQAGGWLAPQALVYAEWPAQDAPPLAQPPWRLGRVGAVAFALFRPGADWR